MIVVRLVLVACLACALPGQPPDLKEIYRHADVLLAQPSPGEVDRAIVRLGCAGERAVPALELLLCDPRLAVRAQVYCIVEEIGKPAKRVVGALMNRATSYDLWERIRVSQLALKFDPRNEIAMRLLAQCDNKNYRTDAAGALGSARGQGTLRLLTRLIDDDYASVRKKAFQSAGDLGERALPMASALIDAMTSKRAPKLDIEDIPGAIHAGGERLRGASRALFEIGRSVVPELMKRHAKAPVREQYRALNVLGSMGERAAQRQAAHRSMLSADADLRRIAFECLMNLPSDPGADLPAVLESVTRFPTDADSKRIDQCLEDVPRAFEVLKKVFAKVRPKQRTRLAAAAARLSIPIGKDSGWRLRRAELLLVAARDEDAEVRRASARAVTTILAAESEAATILSVLPVLRVLAQQRTDVGTAVGVLRAIVKTGPEKPRAAAVIVLKVVWRGP